MSNFIFKPLSSNMMCATYKLKGYSEIFGWPQFLWHLSIDIHFKSFWSKFQLAMILKWQDMWENMNYTSPLNHRPFLNTVLQFLTFFAMVIYMDPHNLHRFKLGIYGHGIPRCSTIELNELHWPGRNPKSRTKIYKCRAK